METTIQVTKELKDTLSKRKISSKDSYEDIIWDLLEDTLELNEQTKKDIAVARAEYKEGKTKSLSQIKKELGM